MTLAVLSTPDKPLRNFEDDLDTVMRPRHPSEVDWTGRWHLKVVYEIIFNLHLHRRFRRIRSVRTFALLTRTCTSQAWRHIRALEQMGLLDVDWGQCARHHGDADPSIIALRCFADVEHLPSVSVDVPTDPSDTSTSAEMFHIRELDPWGPDNELWDPSGLGSHGREVALAALRTGPASINAIATETTFSWHTVARALHGLEALGMATCTDGLWTVIEQAITVEVTTDTYDGAVTAAQDLHHGGQTEEALAIVTALAYCKAVGNEEHQPRRRRYVAAIRHQRQEYKEGPSSKWIRRSSGDRWGRVNYRLT